MSWLDIDTILAEEERLPCIFSTDCPTLGHLDKNNSNYGQTLPKGSRVELSLWLAESLAQKGMVEIEFPKHYGPKMRDQLNSSSVVNLREYSPYFFDVGLRLSHLRKDTDLLRTLRTTFSGDRFKNLMGHCLGQDQIEDTEYTQTLTTTELAIFTKNVWNSKDLKRWRLGQSSILEAAPILSKKIMKDHENNQQTGKKPRFNN